MRTAKPKSKKSVPNPTKKPILEKKPEIPQRVLKKFVGSVPYLMQITATHVYNNRFRVNVWTEQYFDDKVVPKIKIEKSFFVHYHDGIIIDETIQPKPQENGKKGLFR